MKNEAIIYFQNLMQFFIKKGKKPRVEKLFRAFLTDRAKEKRKDLNLLDLMHKCLYYATPFVRLKTRRKRKRILYRVTFLEQPRGEKKALMTLSKKLQNQKSKAFMSNWEKELAFVASGKSDVTIKRNDLHKTAYRFCPFSWKRTRSKVLRRRKNKSLGKNFNSKKLKKEHGEGEKKNVTKKRLTKIEFLISKWKKKRVLKEKKALSNRILKKRRKKPNLQ